MFSKAVVPLMEASPAGQHGVRSRRTHASSQEVSSIVQFMFENELWELYESFPPFSDVIKLVPV